MRWLLILALSTELGCGGAAADYGPAKMPPAVQAAPLRAERSARLSARIAKRTGLLYTPGADDETGRPPHVRAGSALTWVPASATGTRAELAVIQDDALFLALVDPATAVVTPHALPAGYAGARVFDDASGNKAYKLDLEALATIGERLFAFGSGSTDARELAVSISGFGRTALDARVLSAKRLYDTMRRARAFAGSELNIEGAAHVGSHVLFVQRGNGRTLGGVQPSDAIARVDASTLVRYLDSNDTLEPPELSGIVRYDLGTAEGVRLTFTDVANDAVSGRLFYLAAAEASPDTIRDGVVVGTALGVIDGDSVRFAPLLDEQGAPFTGKPEGLALDPRDPKRAYIVLDRDDPAVPAELCEVSLSGF